MPDLHGKVWTKGPSSGNWLNYADILNLTFARFKLYISYLIYKDI